jgi:hypothetical protein
MINRSISCALRPASDYKDHAATCFRCNYSRRIYDICRLCQDAGKSTTKLTCLLEVVRHALLQLTNCSHNVENNKAHVTVFNGPAIRTCEFLDRLVIFLDSFSYGI